MMVHSKIIDVPQLKNGGCIETLELICPPIESFDYLVRAFPVRHQLTLFLRSRDFSAMQHQVSQSEYLRLCSGVIVSSYLLLIGDQSSLGPFSGFLEKVHVGPQLL